MTTLDILEIFDPAIDEFIEKMDNDEYEGTPIERIAFAIINVFFAAVNADDDEADDDEVEATMCAMILDARRHLFLVPILPTGQQTAARNALQAVISAHADGECSQVILHLAKRHIFALEKYFTGNGDE